MRGPLLAGTLTILDNLHSDSDVLKFGRLTGDAFLPPARAAATARGFAIKRMARAFDFRSPPSGTRPLSTARF